MDLSIIIVNWHSREHLRKCLASILLKPCTMAAEILVIDSGSFDGTGDMLRAHFPAVRFIQADRNLGFAKANNLAATQARGRCLLFLNPDTEIVGAAIDQLFASACGLPGAGTVGGKLLNGDGTLQSSCVQTYPTILNQFLGAEVLMARWPISRLWGDAIVRETASGVREVDAISGACVMVRREVFEQVGRFTEDYFMYAEDIDLSYKVHAAGYRNYYVADAVVVHYGGASSSQAASAFTAVMMREAIWRFLRRTRGPWYGRGYRLAMLSVAIGRVALLTPAIAATRPSLDGTAARDKWLAILRWTVRRDRIVRQYYVQ